MKTITDKPTLSLLCKLASIAVHADEMLSPGGHQFDKIAITSVLNDPEVKEFIALMAKNSLVPLKRS